MDKPIETVMTALAGVTFTNEDGINRQKVIRYCKTHDIKLLELVREPHNKVDSNAIAVFAKVISGDLVKKLQLGYIRNRKFECITCGAHYDKVPDRCICGSSDFAREGLATELAKAMDLGAIYACTVEEYTGGEGTGEDGKPKNLGVNVKIQLIEGTRPLVDNTKVEPEAKKLPRRKKIV